MTKLIRAFILGMLEFRLSFTIRTDSVEETEAYDFGRESMHRLTLRMFEVY